MHPDIWKQLLQNTFAGAVHRLRPSWTCRAHLEIWTLPEIRWFGHVVRANTILQSKVDEKGSGGRPAGRCEGTDRVELEYDMEVARGPCGRRKRGQGWARIWYGGSQRTVWAGESVSVMLPKGLNSLWDSIFKNKMYTITRGMTFLHYIPSTLSRWHSYIIYPACSLHENDPYQALRVDSKLVELQEQEQNGGLINKPGPTVVIIWMAWWLTHHFKQFKHIYHFWLRAYFGLHRILSWLQVLLASMVTVLPVLPWCGPTFSQVVCCHGCFSFSIFDSIETRRYASASEPTRFPHRHKCVQRFLSVP